MPSVFSSRPHVSQVSTKHVDALTESVMFVPAVVFRPNDQATHYQRLAESKGKRLQRKQSLCQEAFLFSGYTVTLKSSGVCTQCVFKVTIGRYLAFKIGFLERQSTLSSFLLKYFFRQTSIAPT